jgi:hypothetical protein
MVAQEDATAAKQAKDAESRKQTDQQTVPLLFSFQRPGMPPQPFIFVLNPITIFVRHELGTLKTR